MALGERIKECRLSAKLSQENVAELVGVSRQAVTKWESNQTSPSTENLFKLAEIFGTTVDLLLKFEDRLKESPAEQIYYLYKLEQEQKSKERGIKIFKNIKMTFIFIATYLIIYLIGKIIWGDFSNSNLMEWLFGNRTIGDHSYLFGWLLTSNLYWISLFISCIPSLFGKYKFSTTSIIGFVSGLILGIIFGPNPAGIPYGHGHNGWWIWGMIFLISIIFGILVEMKRIQKLFIKNK